MEQLLNEKILIDKFLNLESKVNSVQEYIKENYHINSEYDPEFNMMYIWSNNVNESLNLAAAKEHILEEVGTEFVEVIYGKKQA